MFHHQISKGHSDVKRFLIALCVAGQLSACASSATLNHLEASRRACAQGDATECNNAAEYEQEAARERSDGTSKAGDVALALVAIPVVAGLLVLGAWAASQPTYQSSTTCSSYGFSTTCNTWSR
jgi:hypothetical protein